MSAKEEIEAFIKKSGTDIETSAKEASKYLLNNFDHGELFNVISDYMYNTLMEKIEWITCARTLCEIDRVQANKRFIEALQVNDPDKRYRIVKLLWGYGTEDVVPTLIKMLKEDPEPDIRFMVAMALGEIGDKRALPALDWSVANDKDANHDDTTIAWEAMKSIEKIKNITLQG